MLRLTCRGLSWRIIRNFRIVHPDIQLGFYRLGFRTAEIRQESLVASQLGSAQPLPRATDNIVQLLLQPALGGSSVRYSATWMPV
jgi:hypothetical protein